MKPGYPLAANDGPAVVPARGDRAALGGERTAWRWTVELALTFAALWGLDAMLPPRFDMIAASPSLLWLPVLSFSAVYGKGAGLTAALIASALWIAAGEIALIPGQDFYEMILVTGRAPTFWILAALGFGDISDRWRHRQAKLEAEVRDLHIQRTAIADYATALRDHIDTLEFTVATSTESAKATLPQCLGVLEHHANPVPALREAASLILGCDRALLWWLEDETSWRAADEGEAILPPAGLRERLDFCQTSVMLPLEWSTEEISSIGIAAPIRHPLSHNLHGAVLFESWSADLEPDAALSLAHLIARRLARTVLAPCDLTDASVPHVRSMDRVGPQADRMRLAGGRR